MSQHVKSKCGAVETSIPVLVDEEVDDVDCMEKIYDQDGVRDETMVLVLIGGVGNVSTNF